MTGWLVSAGIVAAGLAVDALWLWRSAPRPAGRAAALVLAASVGFVLFQAAWLVSHVWLEVRWPAAMSLANGLWHVVLAPVLLLADVGAALVRRARRSAR